MENKLRNRGDVSWFRQVSYSWYTDTVTRKTWSHVLGPSSKLDEASVGVSIEPGVVPVLMTDHAESSTLPHVCNFFIQRNLMFPRCLALSAYSKQAVYRKREVSCDTGVDVGEPHRSGRGST